MVPGGDLYPTLIRKTPIKPIKVFLQDGSADLDNVHGNWFLANQQMLAALEFANRTADAKKDHGPALRGPARVGRRRPLGRARRRDSAGRSSVDLGQVEEDSRAAPLLRNAGFSSTPGFILLAASSAGWLQREHPCSRRATGATDHASATRCRPATGKRPKLRCRDRGVREDQGRGARRRHGARRAEDGRGVRGDRQHGASTTN